MKYLPALREQLEKIAGTERLTLDPMGLFGTSERYIMPTHPYAAGKNYLGPFGELFNRAQRRGLEKELQSMRTIGEAGSRTGARSAAARRAAATRKLNRAAKTTSKVVPGATSVAAKAGGSAMAPVIGLLGLLALFKNQAGYF